MRRAARLDNRPAVVSANSKPQLLAYVRCWWGRFYPQEYYGFNHQEDGEEDAEVGRFCYYDDWDDKGAGEQVDADLFFCGEAHAAYAFYAGADETV